ncbi:MAG TPA: hypothetical protein VE983_10210, partial [Solirubrobacteraceae bacterium]|nr:hypothetical protein [Solirubrobacteraceae bacterium]
MALASWAGLLGLLGPAAPPAGATSHPPIVRAANASGRFHSEPWLHPYPVRMSADPDRSSGDIFLTPRRGHKGGLIILNPEGQLVWFHSLKPERGGNLRVQSYRGQPVLTWWQGRRSGDGEDVIVNGSYRTVAVVRAGRGYRTDPHDFVLTPQGT